MKKNHHYKFQACTAVVAQKMTCLFFTSCRIIIFRRSSETSERSYYPERCNSTVFYYTSYIRRECKKIRFSWMTMNPTEPS